jgi:catechol 2,3-dioxygenase-like lactoylglutathione lyase family enzyme
MVGYTTMGTSDLDRAIGFFDALLGEFGGKQIFKTDRLVMWGREMGDGMFGICTPFDEKAASIGNGTMVAFSMNSTDEVDRFHAKALELGATDEGAPGERMPGAYFSYFRDLDGNKFCAYKFGG